MEAGSTLGSGRGSENACSIAGDDTAVVPLPLLSIVDTHYRRANRVNASSWADSAR